MREIKFRGKTKRNGKWIYGLLGYCNFNRGVERAIFQATELGSIIPERISNETVGQFTGLRDKNGVEIYEGDIVKATNFEGGRYIGKILYNEGACCYRVVGSLLNYALGVYQEDIEVIGNIYDNPELLEVEE